MKSKYQHKSCRLLALVAAISAITLSANSMADKYSDAAKSGLIVNLLNRH